GAEDLPLELAHLVHQPAEQVRGDGPLPRHRGADDRDEAVRRRLAPADEPDDPGLDGGDEVAVVDLADDEDRPGEALALDGPEHAEGVRVEGVADDDGDERVVVLVAPHDPDLRTRPELAHHPRLGDRVPGADPDRHTFHGNPLASCPRHRCRDADTVAPCTIRALNVDSTGSTAAPGAAVSTV